MGRIVEWSDEDRQRALALWDEGKSARTISKLIPGRSRNAVLGLIHRAGKANQRIAPNRQRIVKTTPSKAIVVKVDPAGELLPLDPPIYMVDLENKHCRWPYDDTQGLRYCGRDKKRGSSFCEDHVKKAFQPSKPNAKCLRFLLSDS